ncbi:MAG TPA: alpha/beta hydrolase [Labilithrix sp.]|nr:alpha/beta hydrolase [Labilithrix sp.]
MAPLVLPGRGMSFATEPPEARMSVSPIHGRVSLMLVCAFFTLAACDRRNKATSASAQTELATTAAPELRAVRLSTKDAPTNEDARDPLKAARAEMRKLLHEYDALGARSIAGLSVEEARKQPTIDDAMYALMRKESKDPDPIPMARVEDRRIPGPVLPIPIRIYTPKADPKERGPRGVVLYFHGGGFVLGSVESYDRSARIIAKNTGALVVSAGYRRAPEHKFPAAHDDAFAAYEWLVMNAASIDADPKRIALAGEGSGANLAANVAIMARDRKGTGLQQPVHQLLIYPMTMTNHASWSAREWANAKPLDTASLKWLEEKTLRSARDKDDPRRSLLDAPVKGVPSATILLAEIDPLWSEGEAFYRHLGAEGVKAERRTYNGLTHEFFGLGVYVYDARKAQEWAGERLQEALARSAKPR